jgi:hypothetical protein
LARVRTHYDNLKVSRDAPAEVIHAAFNSLAAKYSPGVKARDSEATRIAMIVNRSYAVLSDPAQRAEHDKWIAEAEGQQPRVQDVPIPEFQQVTERRFPGWFATAAIGVLAALFLIGLFLVVRKGTPNISRAVPSSAAAPVIPAPPPGFDFDQPPQPKQAPPNNAQRPVRSEIDEVIRSGKYSQLPRAEEVGESTGSGPSHLSILNQTGYALTISFSGAMERSVEITSGQIAEVDFTPGTYSVLGRVSNPIIIPFAGDQSYSAGTKYQSIFSVRAHLAP